jgi:LPXTG-motif cell wall-anchored protein
LDEIHNLISPSEPIGFVDEEHYDFHLTENSFAVDTGIDLPLITEDVDGKVRPTDGNESGTVEWDIGVFEFNSYVETDDDAEDDEGGDDDTGSSGGSSGSSGSSSSGGSGDELSEGLSDDTNETTSSETVIAHPGGPYQGLVNETIRFDGSQSSPAENITLYVWDLGDDTKATGKIITHVYTNPGNFTITLTVTTTTNQTDTTITYAQLVEPQSSEEDTILPVISHLIDSDGIKGLLIDSDYSGVFDVFTNDNNGITTGVMQTADGLYLLDTDDDGIWDFAYDILNDLLISYDEIQKETGISPFLFVALGMGIISLLGALFFYKKKY